MNSSLSFRGPISKLTAFIKAKFAALMADEAPPQLPVYLKSGEAYMHIKNEIQYEIILPKEKIVRAFSGLLPSLPYRQYKAGKLTNQGFELITEREYYEAWKRANNQDKEL